MLTNCVRCLTPSSNLKPSAKFREIVVQKFQLHQHPSNVLKVLSLFLIAFVYNVAALMSLNDDLNMIFHSSNHQALLLLCVCSL